MLPPNRELLTVYIFALYLIMLESRKTSYCIFVNSVCCTIDYLKHGDIQKKSRPKSQASSKNFRSFLKLKMIFFFLQKFVSIITRSTKRQSIELILKVVFFIFILNRCDVALNRTTSGYSHQDPPSIFLGSRPKALGDCMVFIGVFFLPTAMVQLY